MQNSRLLELFSTFDRKEIREGRKFLASPFFNHRKDVCQLFELMVASNAPTKAEVSEALFPGEAFEPQRVRQVMSWLQKLLEQYLVVKTSLADPDKSSVQLARIFRRRNLERHFSAAVREAAAQLQKSRLHNGNYHRQNYLLLHEKHLLAAKSQRTGEQHLQALTDQHDAFFLIEKLRQACLIRSHQAVNKVDYDLGLLVPLLSHLPDSLWEKWPAAGLYFSCFRMLDELDGRPHFTQLKSQLEQHRHLLAPTELREVYLFAINFSIRQLNGGDANFAREAFQLYREALAAKLLTLDGDLSRFAYRNIVALGLQEQELAWAETFWLLIVNESSSPIFRPNCFATSDSTDTPCSCVQRPSNTSLYSGKLSPQVKLISRLSASVSPEVSLYSDASTPLIVVNLPRIIGNA